MRHDEYFGICDTQSQSDVVLSGDNDRRRSVCVHQAGQARGFDIRHKERRSDLPLPGGDARGGGEARHGAARTQHQNDELRIQDNLGVALRSGAPYGRALARNVCRPHASAVGRAAAQGIRRRPAAARGRGGDKRRRRLRRRIRHVLCAALRRRLYVERAARLCARSANAPIHGRRGAEGNALRRADAGGGYLYKHIDAGQFRHTPR